MKGNREDFARTEERALGEGERREAWLEFAFGRPYADAGKTTASAQPSRVDKGLRQDGCKRGTSRKRELETRKNRKTSS